MEQTNQNQENDVKENKENNNSLLSLVENVGKAVYSLFKEVTPKLVEFGNKLDEISLSRQPKQNEIKQIVKSKEIEQQNQLNNEIKSPEPILPIQTKPIENENKSDF